MREQYSTEENIRVAVSGLRGEDGFMAWCRREESGQSCSDTTRDPV
jgi:hypothetical protein